MIYHALSEFMVRVYEFLQLKTKLASLTNGDTFLKEILCQILRMFYFFCLWDVIQQQ